MGERMTEDDLVAAWDDGRRGEIWDELVRARESEKRLVEALYGALHHLTRVRDKCEYDHYSVHEVNGALEEPIQRAREALSAAGVKT